MLVLSNNGKILHLLGWDKKFVPPFIDFTRENFESDQHLFLIYGPIHDGTLLEGPDLTYYYYPSLLKELPALLGQIRRARKVILHGLFSAHLYYALALQPWVLKKCYWAIWGGDLYTHNAEIKDWRWHKSEWFRRFVISRLGHCISHIKGDYDLARQWYGAKGKWHECLLYPNNVYKPCSISPKRFEGANILVGNSASSTNHHFEALEILRPFAGENIRVYCPLSYGDKNYADRVARAGKAMFGDKFIALREFMPFEQYLRFLAEIDIAVFNHYRQQGVCNITALLGLGVKVYVRTGITTKSFFDGLNVRLFDIAEINLDKLSEHEQKHNLKVISNTFTAKRLTDQWSRIYES